MWEVYHPWNEFWVFKTKLSQLTQSRNAKLDQNLLPFKQHVSLSYSSFSKGATLVQLLPVGYFPQTNFSVKTSLNLPLNIVTSWYLLHQATEKQNTARNMKGHVQHRISLKTWRFLWEGHSRRHQRFHSLNVPSSKVTGRLCVQFLYVAEKPTEK